MSYVPFSEHYSVNAENFFNHDEVKEAQDLIDKYSSQSAKDDFKLIERMRRAGDSDTVERLMHDWCAHHEIMSSETAGRINEIRRRLNKCPGAAVSDEVYDETRNKVLDGTINKSLVDALFDKEKQVRNNLFKSLGDAIHFQYRIANEVNSAPWVTMTDDELIAFAEEWEQQRRIDNAISGIREIASGQKTMHGSIDFKKRWPQAFETRI